MDMNLTKSALLACCMLFALAVDAQDKPDYASGQKSWSIGIEAGTTMPYTDVTQFQVAKVPLGGPVSELGYNVGLVLMKHISPVFSFYGRANYGQLQGYKSATTDYNIAYLDALFQNENDARSISSKTPLIVGEVGFIINFSNISFSYRNADQMKKYLWYGSFGMGGLNYDPTIDFTVEGFNEQFGRPASQSRYVREFSGSTFPLFVGLGVRRHLSPSLDLGAEFKLGMANSDLIDGVFLPGSSNDTYSTVNVNLLYNFELKGSDKEAYALHWVHPTDLLLHEHHKEDSTETGTGATSEDMADSDGDGVPNAKDEEPFTRYGAQVDERGIALDDDKDGVPNGIDKEDNTPEGVLVNYFGQHIKLPTTSPQSATGSKPSNPTPTNTAPIRPTFNAPSADIAYYPSIYFGSNSTAINAGDAQRLVRVGRTMQDNPSIRIKLIGHADKTGPADYNKMLAEKRVQNVKNFLVNNLHIDGSRIETQVKGDSEPVSKTLNYVNRRVDVVGN